MVNATVVVLVALTAVATANPPPYDDYEPPPPSPEGDSDDSPAFNMFGFTMAIGALPIAGTDTRAMSIGLAVEHPVFRKTRVLGEYDWMWLLRRDQPSSATMIPGPEDHGSGHRASLGLRRELVGKGGRRTRVFVDGELGASLALVNNNMTGVELVPAVFTGLRIGYDLYSRRDDSPSGTFETGLLLRAIAMREGVGLTFGIGMFWGN